MTTESGILAKFFVFFYQNFINANFYTLIRKYLSLLVRKKRSLRRLKPRIKKLLRRQKKGMESLSRKRLVQRGVLMLNIIGKT